MKKYSGFTLVELMVTLVVAIILMTIGLPWFDSIRANNRAVALQNGLATALNLARNNAITIGLSSAVCSKSTTTSQVCGTAAEWSNGWFVFQDEDEDGTVDPGEDIVKMWDAPAAGASITTTAAVIRYTPRGELDGAAQAFELDQTDRTSSNLHKCLEINQVGQLAVSKFDTSCPPP